MNRYLSALGRTAALVVVASTLAACSSSAAGAPTITVYKSPTCGCCEAWARHLAAAGFRVETEDVLDMTPVKVQHGITQQLASCHTAVIEGYVIEGHVPADVIMRLLDEGPEVAGLTVPGMPIGSPGMEAVGMESQPYDVLAFDENGRTAVYESRR